MFSDIQKKMAEATERWQKIDELKLELEDNLISAPEKAAETTAKLVILLIEQLKPMSAMDGADLEQGMKQVFEALSGGK